MAKTKVLLACRECGRSVGQWMGRCPSCAAWGSIEAGPPAEATGTAPILSLLDDQQDETRLSSGFPGADRVLGGGLCRGSVVLVAGEPGIGKSTLLLQVAGLVAAAGGECLYASGEESRGQVAARARRLSIAEKAVSFIPGRDLPDVLASVRQARPDLLIVDSIQALRDPDQSSLPGGPSQVRACADALVGLAKERDVTVILAGQVTKVGEVAGPRTLEHAVDVVCSFDGDARTGLRVLAGGKNRFGAEGEVAWFEMSASGLTEVDGAARLSPSQGEAGAAVAVLTAGRRALAVEVQALVVPTDGPPRRHVSGLDPRRFNLVAAVTDRALGLRLSRAEVYGTAAGGLQVAEPGTDLAVAAAVASAASGRPPPPRTAFVGEIALTGAVRPTPNMAARLAAAGAAGMGSVVVPAGAVDPPTGVTLTNVRHLRDALFWATGAKQAPDQRF
ncbi:MAG TPA: AAA family ATPase [Actinomycetota bacterium]